MKLRYCPHCANKGLLKLCYRSGEPFDLAICDCAAGHFWRKAGEAIIRERLGVAATCAILRREDVDGAEIQPQPGAREGYTAAGQTAKRAKL